MKIHMIGHASIFVETQDCRILMDPVLWEFGGDGRGESCPKREVIHEKLPEFDFLVISHRHVDHFDVRSLAYLPKKVDVLIPKDKLLTEALCQMGYSRIYSLGDFSKVLVGSTTMLTTRSEIPVPEYGMVFADESGVLWNAVDSRISPQTIQKVKDLYPCIDLFLAPWQLLLQSQYQSNQSLSFPFFSYGEQFDLLSLIQPKAIIPGAAGFKHTKESSWLNQVVFPVTRERFCHDVKMVFPEIEENIFALDPGDILTFDMGEYHHLVGGCEYVKNVVDDRECLDFSPVKVNAELVDSNPENYDELLIRQAIYEEICSNLPKFIMEHRESLFQEHCRWNVIYQLEVVFPDGCQKWHIDFSQSPIKAEEGRNPLANYFTYIPASSFYGLIQKKISWDYLYLTGEHRTFQKVYSITHLGIIPADADKIKDPLKLRFTDYIVGSIPYRELAKWRNHNLDNSQVDEDPNPMLRLGEDILIKPRKKVNIV